MQTVLLGLNEINFDYVKHYASKGLLPNLEKLLQSNDLVVTKSEDEYELQEPWIQWVTTYSGLTYSEHQIFRLGDIVDRQDVPQLFEEIESMGYSVAAVSPFNADNRLKKPVFFIPDPWTQTSISAGNLLTKLFTVLRKQVNQNAAGKTGLDSVPVLLLGLLKYVPVKRWPTYIKNILGRKKPGFRAILLDRLLSDIFIKEWNSSKPDFANLFLNSGAHIQHHYLFNSGAYDGALKNPSWYCEPDHDPLLAILQEYDDTISRILEKGDVNLILMTGLHQVPHGHATYYWRPRSHENLMNMLGLTNMKAVTPRMSRDFLIDFSNESDAKTAEDLLNSYHPANDDTKMKIFSVDNRGDSLFVELVYSNDIDKSFAITSSISGATIEGFRDHIDFVAIKNGEHNGDGYLISNRKLPVDNPIPLTETRNLIINSVQVHA